MPSAKSVTIRPASPDEITRVAKALHAAVHVNEGVHGRIISPWSKRLDSEPYARLIWEGLAIAAIDMCTGSAARL